MEEKTDAVKVTYLLLWLGEQGREIFETLELADDKRKIVKDTCEAIEKHVTTEVKPCIFKIQMQQRGTGRLDNRTVCHEA